MPPELLDPFAYVTKTIVLLDFEIEHAEELLAYEGRGLEDKYRAWNESASRALSVLFGPCEALNRFQEPSRELSWLHPQAVYKNVIGRQLPTLVKIRESIHPAYELHLQTATENLRNGILDDMLRQVLRRFQVSAQTLGKRTRAGKDGSCYACADEYDVQDLLYAMLKPLLPDLEREDPTPKVSGDSGRTDLSSQERGMIIEVKRVRSDGHAKDIPGECRDRVFKYGAWEGLRDLIFFIYDPDGHIRDRDNFVSGLDLGMVSYKNQARQFRVDCIVAPS